MSALSREVRRWFASSLSSSSSSGHGGKEKKNVVFYYPTQDDKGRVTGSIICVSVDSLIPNPCKTRRFDQSKKACKKSYLKLSGKYLNLDMSFICTATTSVGGPGIYLFGGVDNYDCPDDSSLIKKVYHYDIHKLPKKGKIKQRADTIFGVDTSLSAQVGDDCIYVLSSGETSSVDRHNLRRRKLVFQEYNFEKDKWALLVRPGDDDIIINKGYRSKWALGNICRSAHVVIGPKLHVSIGNSSFTFDSGKRVWEKCKLFETFWSEQENKKSGLSPSDFYGGKVWSGLGIVDEEDRNEFGGPPFGFYGRGILWNNNILLGVHQAENCPVVAFLLDDDDDDDESSGRGVVVKSQCVTSDSLGMDGKILSPGSCLVDIGRDYIGLVHFLNDKMVVKDYDDWAGTTEYTLLMELVTFKVSRPPPQKIDDDDDHFLECQLVRKDLVARNLPGSVYDNYNAFCV